MGKMKELFIEQMNKQIDEQMIDADYQYNEYVNQKAIDELNESMKLKYSESDIKYALESTLGDANSLNEVILSQLNELYNLRNGYTD